MEVKLKDNTVVEIREAQVTDAKAILDFFNQVNLETKNLMREPNEYSMTLEEETAFLEKTVSSKDNYMCAAFLNERCISTAGFHGSSLQRVHHRVSMGISVLRDYHNLGLGSYMMKNIVDYAKIYGKQKVELEVRVDNINAIHLYQKFGFIQEGLISKGFFVDNQYVDLITMAKFI
ncbi:MAG: GNAT family N-acetyltransferase [Bacilli bacterium]|nr:GNAT family N-acetyltransferase [Bacilli bacterium]